jgi:hypothetical protein
MLRLIGYALRQLAIVGLLVTVGDVVLVAQAQPALPSNPAGIYTCIDARGRKLTADRPIVECLDREQKILNPSGTVKAKVGPSLTAQERADQEARQKAAFEEQARISEEKRRDRALLTRYPSRAVHDEERAQALTQIGVVRQAALHRVEELMRQRTAINDEMEFYKKDPSKAPPAVRRQVDELAQSLAIQGRFIADQDAEIKRVNARFDEELLRLKQLWALLSPVPSGTTSKAR